MIVSSARLFGIWLVDIPIIALALGLVAGVISWCYCHGIALCLFHRVIGLPCPFCGGTRAVVFLLKGELTYSLAYNPLVFMVSLIAPFYLLLRPLAISSHKVQEWRNRAIFAAVMANWFYLIVVGR